MDDIDFKMPTKRTGRELVDAIRCKDCKYSKRGMFEDTVWCTNEQSALNGWQRKNDWFCADGERKET